MEKKNIHELELHETITVGHIVTYEVTKVVNGWLYHNYASGTMCFVPEPIED